MLCLGQKKDSVSNFVFKINATSLIDIFSFPTLQLSLEKRFYRDITLAGEIGCQLYNARKTDTMFINSNGWKANVEVRVYDIFRKLKLTNQKRSTSYGTYFGINFFNRQNKYNAEIPYTKANDTLAYKDCLSVNRKNWGGNLVVGYQSKLSKKYILDVYGGIGLMKADIKNDYREINNNDTISGTDLVPLFYSWNLSEHSGWQANINFGIRLGISL